jgi:amino acid transporter
MSFLDLLLGKPLSSEEEAKERVGTASGVSIFGLDALSSSAYGPEAALTILIPLGVVGLHYLIPITAAIILLLLIVYSSYFQTIGAYPNGGGSYTVAGENLGQHVGLLAASALMIDYVLDIAVGISAGVGALISAFPVLQPRTLELCLAILVLLTIINLRGIREAGLVFVAPTYLFIFSLLGVIALGVVKAMMHGGHPPPVDAIPQPKQAVEAVSLWLLLKSFASGCTALTGVEAVSNGVTAFKEPRTKTARMALTIIIFVLILMLAGIAYLVQAYNIPATQPGAPGYQSVLSMMTLAVIGRGAIYYVTIASILVVLCLSANTAFADFPRLLHAIAQNRYLPTYFTFRGRRLVYSQGVLTVTILAGALLIAFRGVTDRLIPLFAIGAFLAFTLSQLGMVYHWRRQPRTRATQAKMVINAIGALATGITICIVLSAKFLEGAWIVVLVVPALILLMLSIRRHYDRIGREITASAPITFEKMGPPIVVVPIERWSRVAEKALRFAFSLSPQVKVLHVELEEDPGQTAPNHDSKSGSHSQSDDEDFTRGWHELVEVPAARAGVPAPELIVLKSPYRQVVEPIVECVKQLEAKYPNSHFAVIVPEIVERHWYNFFLHNQRASMLKASLYLHGDPRISVINVPWYVE